MGTSGCTSTARFRLRSARPTNTLLSKSLSLLLLFVVAGATRGAEPLGAFFEPAQPFFHAQVEIAPRATAAAPDADGNFVVRGVLLPLGGGHCAVFDQELLRVAGVWRVPSGTPLVTLDTMALISYVVSTRKASVKHPRPTGPLLLTSRMQPGISRASDLSAPRLDPRPPARECDEGRGPLPADFARYAGLELTDAGVVLRYTVDTTAVRERLEARGAPALRVVRHFEISATGSALQITLGRLTGGRVSLMDGSGSITLAERDGEHVAFVAPSPQARAFRVTFDFPEETFTPAAAGMPRAKERRWPESTTAPAKLDYLSQNGLILDHIAVPEANPWNRRVRPADLAFLSDDQAAVVTFDGDVWLVSGFVDPELARLEWRRFASGLHEPLAIAAPGGVIQVATKNGIIRLHDRDTNGEADEFENFNDQVIQSQTTRSFPLDMAVAPDGATFVTQGGIVTQSGLASGGTGTAHTGAFLKVSRDGRSLETFARAAREPFLAVHPVTGVVTGTDQQGHYIPSTPVYLVRRGDSFGFLEKEPAPVTPPLVWIPHDQDISAGSQVWMHGQAMGPWHDRLLHLSYGSGRLLLVAPDFDALVPQGAVIPLEFKTGLPLLHGRMHPRGDAVFLAGFQIWGTQTPAKWSLGRLRRGPAPITTALHATSCREGVVLTFANPLSAASVTPQAVRIRSWNYRRSAAYGSGRYAHDDSPGVNRHGVGQTVLARDGRSAFIHVPHLRPTMQLEVRHDFLLAGGEPARGAVYFTIHALRDLDLAAAGFPAIDFTRGAVATAPEKEPLPTVAQGRALTDSLGCIACHSTDGTTEGKVGPSWNRIFGAKREFATGGSATVDEYYLREKILDPQKNRISEKPAEMPSYRGVVSDQQLESIVLYLRSLK
jgi:cytochrome c2